MQLRTFLAKDMKAALANVRAEMGPEAVIVASERAKGGGVMVRAALDFAEQAFAEDEPPQSATVTEFDLDYRDALVRRLRESPKRSLRKAALRPQRTSCLLRTASPARRTGTRSGRRKRQDQSQRHDPGACLGDR